ncbi:hypothetical protein K502DRAFT_345332 [Neoconidiobolus thromboides FSU 785]|nr:hypothetical protein K502DRAFT_345332 [Neoconidiobolus thromboides FSU 785]
MEERLSYLGEVQDILLSNVIIFIVSIIAIFLNTFLLFLNAKRLRFSWRSDKLLICLISVFDLLAALYIFILQVTKWSTGLTLKDDSEWCQSSAIFFSACSFCALLLTSLLSVVRYTVIVKRIPFEPVLLYFVTGFTIVSSFAVFVVISQLHNIIPFPSGWYCLPLLAETNTSSIIYAIYLSIVFVSTLVVLPVCYSLLALHYNKIIEEVYGTKSSKPPIALKRNIIRLIIILVAYYILIFPEMINVMLSMGFKIVRTATSDGLTLTLLFGTSILNPLFAMFLHDETREELYDLVDTSQKWFQLSK